MANLRPGHEAREFDLARDSLRDLNLFLHRQAAAQGVSQISVHNPDGAHSIACGLNADLDVHIHGHVGYYAAGMNKHASVTVHGNAGPGRGREHDVGPGARQGFRLHRRRRIRAWRAAGHRRRRVAALRHLAERRRHRRRRQRRQLFGVHGAGRAARHLRRRRGRLGRLAVRSGDLRARRGSVARRGCALRRRWPMPTAQAVKSLLAAAGLKHDPGEFKRVASAKSLYHWHADANQEY